MVKRKTREKLQVGIAIFMVIAFLITLVPIFF